MIKRIVLILTLIFCTLPAYAEDYAGPTWANIARTLVRFNALDLNDDVLLDEYAMITECDLYMQFYSDDFKWNKVREALRESVRKNVATFPTAFSYEADLQLDRYDFQEKTFRLTDKTALKNINTFVMYESDGLACNVQNVTRIPKSYRAVLDTPLYFMGLPLAQKDAEALLEQMRVGQNKDRTVRVVFNFRVTYIEPLRKNLRPHDSKDAETYSQSNSPDNLSMRLDVRLDSIHFYEDADKTRLIYSYQP